TKKDFEKDFIKRAKQSSKSSDYATLLPEFEQLYKQIAPYSLSRDYFTDVAMRNVELLVVAYRLYGLERSYTSEQSFSEKKENFINAQERFYKNYNKNVDQKVFETTVSLYSQKAPQQFLPEELENVDVSSLTELIYNQSKLTDYESLKKLLEG